ncbi:MAG: hypothetical protein WC889_10500 [Myxococcota bacterium]
MKKMIIAGVLAILVIASMAVSCGIKAPPRPPAQPQAGIAAPGART